MSRSRAPPPHRSTGTSRPPQGTGCRRERTAAPAPPGLAGRSARCRLKDRSENAERHRVFPSSFDGRLPSWPVAPHMRRAVAAASRCSCREQCSCGAPIRRRDRAGDLQPVRGPGAIVLPPIVASGMAATRARMRSPGLTVIRSASLSRPPGTRRAPPGAAATERSAASANSTSNALHLRHGEERRAGRGRGGRRSGRGLPAVSQPARWRAAQ